MRVLPPSLARSRAAGLVGVGVGLLLGATYLPAPIDVAARQDPGTAARAAADPVTYSASVCPGPEALGVEGLRDSSAQRVAVLAASAPAAALPGAFVPDGGRGSLMVGGLPPGGTWPSPVTIRGQVVAAQLSEARSAMVTASGELAAGTVATQWSWSATGSTRGLVTSACLPAAASSWLIAGGAEPGRLEHLVLSNPGANPVTVDLSILGVGGPIQSPNGEGILVAGNARTVILLDAVAGSEPAPVVHVTVRGGKVAAVLSDTWLDGVVPRGGDDAVPTAAPAREQVIAGVPVNGRARLRVAVPGDGEAVVQSRVLTRSGPRPLPADSVTRVGGGSARDIELGSLPPDAYAVQVRADVPVVAAVMVDSRRAASAPSDLAWSVASPPIRTLAGMALPASSVKGSTQWLDCAATSQAAAIRVTTVGADGRASTKEVAIAADSVSRVPLKGASSNGPTSVWVTPGSGLVRTAVVTQLTDASGPMLSLTPLTDLTMTATPSPLRQLPD
jgi:hypothetical protein